MKTQKVKGKEKRSAPFKTIKKRGILTKGKWKAVELDPSVFSEEGLQGLVCFEELTKYRLVDSDKITEAQTKKTTRGKQAARKRKASDAGKGAGEPAQGSTAGTSDQATPKKKRKKGKTKSKPAQQPKQAEESTGEAVTPDEEVKEEETVKEEAVKAADLVEPTKEKKKGKKRKKEAHCKKETASEVQAKPEENAVPNIQPTPAKAPQKKQRSWTHAALSACGNSDTAAWANLFVPPPVLQALSSLGFSSPTAIQALTLPAAIRDHRDVVGAAETGSGKTLAFGIPMIHTILEWSKDPEKEDSSAENNTKAAAEMESLYLPTTDGSEEAPPDQVDPQGDAVEGDAEGGDGESQAGEDLSEEDKMDEDEDREVEAVDDGKLGCVRVINNVEFDFDCPAEEQASRNRPLLGLVLTPTRELAVQVKHHIDAIAKFTDIKTAIVVGGMSQQKQRRMLKRQPEIIIATPGRLWDLIKEKQPHLQNLRQLRCLVIDEADRMVERGHFAELESLLELLHTIHFNPARQMFVFSATLTMMHSLPARVLQKRKRNVEQRSRLEVLMEKVGMKAKPKVVDLTRKEATVETLTETRIHCQKEEKDFFLYYFLLQYPGRTMVFANSIDCIKRLNSLLVILDCTPLPLHANMHQKQRLKNLERFAERERCVLLTTDVAARGLDIPDVQHVIHYQVPRASETYVHRSGRTARATKEGLSLLLIGPDDIMNFRKIYKTLGKDEDLPMFPIETRCMEAIKERVNLARQIEKIEFHNCKEKQHNSWLRQAADALEMDLDDDMLIGNKGDMDLERQQQKMVKGMKAHLKHLISQPVFKSSCRTKYPTQMGKLVLPQRPAEGTESALARVSLQIETLRKNVPQQGKKQKRRKKQQQQQLDESSNSVNAEIST